MIISLHRPVAAQNEVHKGGAQDGYTSVTYYRNPSKISNNLESTIRITPLSIMNTLEGKPCEMQITDILGKQLLHTTIMPNTSYPLNELKGLTVLIRCTIEQEQFIKLLYL